MAAEAIVAGAAAGGDDTCPSEALDWAGGGYHSLLVLYLLLLLTNLHPNLPIHRWLTKVLPPFEQLVDYNSDLDPVVCRNCHHYLAASK